MGLKSLLTDLSTYYQDYPLHDEFSYGAGSNIAAGIFDDRVGIGKSEPAQFEETFSVGTNPNDSTLKSFLYDNSKGNQYIFSNTTLGPWGSSYINPGAGTIYSTLGIQSGPKILSNPYEFSQKTLPFGKDQPKGSSEQPYITTAIPIGDDNTSFKAIANIGGTDIGLSNGGGGVLETINSISSGLIRGGVIGAGIHSVTDILRLTKFGIDLEKGIPFIAKQVGLQLSNVKLEAPSKSATKFNNNRIYNLGVNTIAQAGVNAFGLHFKRHGLFPSPSNGQDDKTGYAFLATRNNKGEGSPGNRLNKILGSRYTEIGLTQPLYSYVGGPKSVYGIGETTIRSYVNTINSSKFFDADLDEGTPTLYNYLSLDQPTSQKQRITPGSKKRISLSNLKDFRRLKGEKYKANSNNFKNYQQSLSSNYGTKNMESRLKIGTGYDKMAHIPIIRATKKQTKTGGDGFNDFRGVGGTTKDLIRFVIEAVNNDEPTQSDYIFFRAFIDGWGDKYKAKWKKYNFVGNPEPFFNYDSFDRDINVSFKIIVFNKLEQKPLYQKLNFLISNLMPDYGVDNTRARAPYIKLTIGDYIDQLPGFITSLSVSETKDSTWEINLDDDTTVQSLPHALDIKMSFQPIHNFIPRKVTPKISNVPFITLNTRNENAIDDKQYFFQTDIDLARNDNASLTTRGMFTLVDVIKEARETAEAEVALQEKLEQERSDEDLSREIAAIAAEQERLEGLEELGDGPVPDASLDLLTEEFIEEEEIELGDLG